LISLYLFFKSIKNHFWHTFKLTPAMVFLICLLWFRCIAPDSNQTQLNCFYWCL